MPLIGWLEKKRFQKPTFYTFSDKSFKYSKEKTPLLAEIMFDF